MAKKTISGEPKEKLVAIRLNNADYVALMRAAANAPLSTWLRDLGLAEAARLDHAGKKRRTG